MVEAAIPRRRTAATLSEGWHDRAIRQSVSRRHSGMAAGIPGQGWPGRARRSTTVARRLIAVEFARFRLPTISPCCEHPFGFEISDFVLECGFAALGFS